MPASAASKRIPFFPKTASPASSKAISSATENTGEGLVIGSRKMARISKAKGSRADNAGSAEAASASLPVALRFSWSPPMTKTSGKTVRMISRRTSESSFAGILISQMAAIPSVRIEERSTGTTARVASARAIISRFAMRMATQMPVGAGESSSRGMSSISSTTGPIHGPARTVASAAAPRR